jgi:hypothetical protein
MTGNTPLDRLRAVNCIKNFAEWSDVGVKSDLWTAGNDAGPAVNLTGTPVQFRELCSRADGFDRYLGGSGSANSPSRRFLDVYEDINFARARYLVRLMPGLPEGASRLAAESLFRLADEQFYNEGACFLKRFNEYYEGEYAEYRKSMFQIFFLKDVVVLRFVALNRWDDEYVRMDFMPKNFKELSALMGFKDLAFYELKDESADEED